MINKLEAAIAEKLQRHSTFFQNNSAFFTGEINGLDYSIMLTKVDDLDWNHEGVVFDNMPLFKKAEFKEESENPNDSMDLLDLCLYGIYEMPEKPFIDNFSGLGDPRNMIAKFRINGSYYMLSVSVS